jgi:hypothetical protein
MSLQQRLQDDLTAALRDRNAKKAGVLKLAISELQREPQKDVPDERTVKILNKMVQSEKEIADKYGAGDDFFTEILEDYLPKQVTEEEVRAWITSNIDLSQFKNKMQAMKPVMTQFAGRIDGNRVKDILNSL